MSRRPSARCQVARRSAGGLPVGRGAVEVSPAVPGGSGQGSASVASRRSRTLARRFVVFSGTDAARAHSVQAATLATRRPRRAFRSRVSTRLGLRDGGRRRGWESSKLMIPTGPFDPHPARMGQPAEMAQDPSALHALGRRPWRLPGSWPGGTASIRIEGRQRPHTSANQRAREHEPRVPPTAGRPQLNDGSVASKGTSRLPAVRHVPVTAGRVGQLPTSSRRRTLLSSSLSASTLDFDTDDGRPGDGANVRLAVRRQRAVIAHHNPMVTTTAVTTPTTTPRSEQNDEQVQRVLPRSLDGRMVRPMSTRLPRTYRNATRRHRQCAVHFLDRRSVTVSVTPWP